ncbi:nicotinate-nucleotide--dimethylbenzimidazole phosphoribosyltransferase [Anaeromassilibacillus senegalensis]|uniref:nicotinate-nucleotide--dimethylbenzimidazole phosphoribosyltransferase n=1 Tax=Anaeromassilibacillus senegalensis TaxID=1673717 RepID=UPI00068169B8|nr:nicotinate-nucleotide--dimethylbenzimidazole phosphoribosyltransferase [Anaeromassilibacillus senegalensis]
MTLDEAIRGIVPPDETAIQLAWQRWDSIAKPLRSLGLLEEALARIAGMTGMPEIDLSRRAVTVFCADNGVVQEGVTQTGQEVTAVVTENLSKGDTSVCRMAQVAHADVFPVDIGVARDVTGGKILHRKIAYGTQNMVNGPAMTRKQAIQALETGIQLALELKENGYQILATGEMGIGNTTTSSAITAVFLRLPPEQVTGRGAGLSSEGLKKKIQAIERAIAINKPDCNDAVDVLCKVGGLDLAGLAGVFLGGALARIPVVVDGFISAAAALAAVRLCPFVKGYLLASHVSSEPAGQLLMRELELQPFITANMSLGEGTGAVAALPILDMACAVYNGMRTFEQIEIAPYQPLA